MHSYQHSTIELIDSCKIADNSCISGIESRKLIKRLEHKYQTIKSLILESSIKGTLNPQDSILLLDALSHIHRLSEQVEKAARFWSSLTPMQSRDSAINQ